MPRVIAKNVVQDHGWRRGVEQVGTRTSMAGLSEVVFHAQRRTKPEGCNSRGMLQAGKARPVSRSERAQARLDLGTPAFEERRQCQGLAQGVHGLVGREAGSVRRDLEEDPARLAEIETAEIEPVDGTAGGHPDL